jgi:glucose-1-phosphate adenylyltransferase
MIKAIGLITTNYDSGRLGKLTAERPVAAVPFGSRYRLLDFALSNLVNSGMRTVGLITPYLYRPLVDHIGAGREWFLDRKRGGLFILPGSNYGLKNMTAKYLLKDLFKNRPFFTYAQEECVVFSAANQVWNMNYQEALENHVQRNADITLFYREEKESRRRHDGFFVILKDKDDKVKDLQPGSALSARETRRLFLDCFIIRRELLLSLMDWYKTMEYADLQDIIAENLGHLRVFGHAFPGYFRRIETIEDYYASNMDCLSPDLQHELFYGENSIHTKVKDNLPARYGPQAQVKNSLIASGCFIEGTVENSILFRKVHIKKGALVRGSVIMQGGQIGEDAFVEKVICDKHAKVENEGLLKGRLSAPVIVGKECVV